jgi:hypothetical protein
MEITEEKQESWALVSAHRITGGDTLNMFGNSVDFPTTMRISVQEAIVKHDLGRTWYHNGKTLLEFDLTPHQWAEFITSTNIGTGTPCTLRQIEGRSISRPTTKKSEYKKIKEEMNQKFSDTTAKLRTYRAQIREVLSKKSLNKEDRAALANQLEIGLRLIEETMPFMAEAMRESAVKVAEETKRNMDAFVQDLTQRHGVPVGNALSAILPNVEQIESGKE